MNWRSKVSFRSLSIRSKLLVGYIAVFLLALGLGGIFLYTSVRATLETNIANELRTSNLGILNMVRTAVDASIRNHLRAVAETNEDIVRHYWKMSQRGELDETEAKKLAGKALLAQVIGQTGYVYCIDSEGFIRVHPSEELLGTDLSGHGFIRRQKELRKGYLEYDWANPGEDRARPKSLYMTYFGPWDWIITASSYREEFQDLFSISDLRDNVLSMTFGQTGYSYVMDFKGNVIIHPQLEGTNIYDSVDSSGRRFIQEICERRNGTIVYPWRNPDEAEAREKLVIFNDIQELGWIVASSSYLKEFYRPLHTVSFTILATVAVMVLLILPTTWWLGSSITQPLDRLMSQFARGVENGSFGVGNVEGMDEVTRLERYYEGFMARLAESHKRLEASEREHRSIFENAVEGIFQSSQDGRFLVANPSMAALLGYDSPDQLINEVVNIRKQLYEDPARRDEMLHLLAEQGSVKDFEARLLRRDGTPVWVSLNVRGVSGEGGVLERVEGFATDISKKIAFKEAQENAKADLEERVRERTAELAGWVRELERLNTEGDLLREMGEHLQVCRASAEAYPVARTYLARLFPEDRTTLYVRHENQQLLEPCEECGARPFNQDECWGVRKGKPHLLEDPASGVACAHLDPLPEHGSLCLPLVAQDDLVGMLEVVFSGAGAAAKGGEQRRAHVVRLGGMVAEHLALALANIHLRDTLRQQSIQDPLTGLYNRRFMEDILNREMLTVKRRGTPSSVIMLDIDHFKSINDTHGHDVGDEVLRRLASHLREAVRGEDIACRYGGEEFLLVLGGAGLADATARAEELRQAVERDVAVHRGKDEVCITVSIGVACAPEHGDTGEQLVHAADAALYRAKEGGRNRVEVAWAAGRPGEDS